jgi:hypothetical protein
MNNEIDIEEDLDHQKKAERFRAVGFTLIILFVFVSALGLFGTGILSETIVGDESTGFYIETEKFLRAGAPAQMIIHLQYQTDDFLELQINNEFLKNVKIESITPLPVEEKNTGENTLFIFTKNSSNGFLIKMAYTPEDPFYHNVNLSAGENRSINFKQIIYP